MYEGRVVDDDDDDEIELTASSEDGKDAAMVLPDDTMMSALLVAGDRYGIAHLVEYASERLASRLSSDNFADFLVLAHRLHAPILVARCAEFVSDKKRLAAVMEAPKFAQLDKEHMQLILRAVSGDATSVTGCKRGRADDDKENDRSAKRARTST